MRTHTVWIDQPEINSGENIKLCDEERHHLKNVLRVRNLSQVNFLNGSGLRGSAICHLDGKNLKLEINDVNSVQQNNKLHLYGPLPKGKRITTLFEKLQEIGVCSFTPIHTEFSQKSDLSPKDLQKLNQKCIEACKQSLCPWLIKINEQIDFKDLLKNKDMLFLNMNGQTANQTDINTSEAHLAFGPEGGWSPVEEESILQENLGILKVSNNILRMETAAILGAGRLLEKLETKN